MKPGDEVLPGGPRSVKGRPKIKPLRMEEENKQIKG